MPMNNPKDYYGIQLFGEEQKFMPSYITDQQYAAAVDNAPMDAFRRLTGFNGWYTVSEHLDPNDPFRIKYEATLPPPTGMMVASPPILKRRTVRRDKDGD